MIYSDGVTEARNAAGEFFGTRPLREIASAHAASSCTELHAAVERAIEDYTEGTPQADDITLVVLEYRP